MKLIITTLILTTTTLSFAQQTGPTLPNPIILPASEGKATVLTTTIEDQIAQKSVITHEIQISGEAARPLYNSLESTPATMIPNSNISLETRLGRNVKCESKTIVSGKPNQSISCTATVTNGEYVDLTLTQLPEETNGTVLPVKMSSAIAKVQARPDGVHMTIVGTMPKARGAYELFSTLDGELDTSQSTAVQHVDIITKNMMTCRKAATKHQTVVSCTTVFKDGVALIPEK